MTRQHVAHSIDELCEAGAALYERALMNGRIPYHDATPAPCLIDHGLLHPDTDDMKWLRPIAPAAALSRALHAIERDIARQRDREARLTAAFESLTALGSQSVSDPDAPEITVLDGLPRINGAITRAMADATEELLTVRPGEGRPSGFLTADLSREQAMLGRGCRIRTLHRQTSRHAPPALAQYERLEGDVEVRTLNEVTDHLLVLDSTVAFVPAHRDNDLAVELRHPALVEYLVTTFERLWRMATPMRPNTAQQPPEHSISAGQRAIAALLTEGLADAEIAARLDMNIRTARAHISKLSATLGSRSRAQLGYLIGQSGILGPEA
ncbi:helix-turn-helix transcriptional regulator [Streptomyces sp. NPDC054855]